MPNVMPLNEPNLSGNFDADKQIFHIHYRGTLTADITTKAYSWLFQNGNTVGLDNIRAFIFDFTKVSQFRRDNTFAAKRQSQTANAVVDLSRIPAALIVNTIYQEQMVILSMKVNGVEDRTKICKSHTHAMSFIEHFHQELAKRDAEETKKAATDL
jgi:hypothetical protein